MKKGEAVSPETRARMAAAARLSWSDPSIRARRVRAAMKRSGSDRTLEAVVVRQIFGLRVEDVELAVTDYTDEGLPVVELGDRWILVRAAEQ